MSDLFPREPSINLRAQIVEVEREIKMRQRVYPRWVSGGRLAKPMAEIRIATLEAVLETLVKLENGDWLS